MRKVSPLREYFQSGYDAGDIFENEEYSFDEELWCWRHEHLGILVWADPLDLRDADDAKEPGEVYFHYTSLLAFRNITNEAKEKVEVWASLITSGEKANAWWGKGIYTVPKPPDEWASTELLLDNNYRSMMRRDREARGDQYVNEEYPKRVQCCIPIVVHPDNAFDVSVRQTPEMRRENKPPGTNLANVELNPPGETRHRTCVVIRNGGRIRRLRSSLKDNHLHAQGDLLTRALRRARQVATKHGLQNDESIRALLRVAIIYSQQSQHAKAKQILEVVVEYRRKMLGEQDLSTLRQRSRLAAVLMNLGKFRQARDLQVRVMRSLPRDSSKVSEQQLEEERQRSLSLLGSMYKMQHKMNVAEPFLIEAYVGRQRVLGETHFDTLESLQDLAFVSTCLLKHRQAIEYYKKAGEEWTKQLGGNHPASIFCELMLAETYALQCDFQESIRKYQDVWPKISQQLGEMHPKSVAASAAHVLVLCEDRQLTAALKIWWRRVCLTGLMGELLLLYKITVHFAKACGVWGIFFLLFISSLLCLPSWSIVLKSSGYLAIPWSISFVPLWLLQVTHLSVAAAVCFGKRPPKRDSDDVRNTPMPDPADLDAYGIQVNLAFLACGVLAALRLDFYVFPWPVTVGPWVLLELVELVLAFRQDYQIISLFQLLLSGLLRILMVLWTPCRAEGYVEWGAWYIVASPALLLALLEGCRACLILGYDGSMSPLSITISVSHSHTLRWTVAKLVAALVCTTLLTGIAYKREVDEEMNIVLLALPLILLALMPLLALIFLQVFVLLNRVKFRLKKSRRGTDRNVALDQVKVSKLLG